MGQASHGRRTSSSSVLDSQVYDNYNFLKAIIIDIRSFVAYTPSTAYSGWGTGRRQEPFVHFRWTMHIGRPQASVIPGNMVRAWSFWTRLPLAAASERQRESAGEGQEPCIERGMKCLSYPSENSDVRASKSPCWATGPWSSVALRVAVTSQTRRLKLFSMLC